MVYDVKKLPITIFRYFWNINDLMHVTTTKNLSVKNSEDGADRELDGRKTVRGFAKMFFYERSDQSKSNSLEVSNH